MKKTITLLLILAMLFSFCSCSGGNTDTQATSGSTSKTEQTAQTEIPPHTHKNVVLEAVPATCKETGLTQGMYCSICNKVFKEQEVVPTTYDHDFQLGKCKVCGFQPYIGGFADDGSIGGGTIKYYITEARASDGSFKGYELVVYGKGAMENLTADGRPVWYDFLPEMCKVTIDKGITSIGSNMFYCDGKTYKLCEFVIADTVKTIKSNAINLEAMYFNLGNGVVTLEDKAIDGRNVAFIHIPKSVKTINYELLCEASCVYEGTLEEFYKIKVNYRNEDMTVKDVIDIEGPDNINIYTNVKGDISDPDDFIDKYWKN